MERNGGTQLVFKFRVSKKPSYIKVRGHWSPDASQWSSDNTAAYPLQGVNNKGSLCHRIPKTTHVNHIPNTPLTTNGVNAHQCLHYLKLKTYKLLNVL